MIDEEKIKASFSLIKEDIKELDDKITDIKNSLNKAVSAIEKILNKGRIA